MFSFFSESDFGGWFFWFQCRLYLSIVNLIVFSSDVVISVIFIAMLVICLGLFYSRRLLFRIVYMIIVGLIVFINVMALPYSLYSLIGQAVVEIVIIIALFRSERVNSAFF